MRASSLGVAAGSRKSWRRRPGGGCRRARLRSSIRLRRGEHRRGCSRCGGGGGRAVSARVGACWTPLPPSSSLVSPTPRSVAQVPAEVCEDVAWGPSLRPAREGKLCGRHREVQELFPGPRAGTRSAPWLLAFVLTGLRPKGSVL